MPNRKRVPVNRSRQMNWKPKRGIIIRSFQFEATVTNYFLSNSRARRRKKLAKAIDRQARKLQAKGITVDLEALKAEYISQHRGSGAFSDSDLEDDGIQIDVVGGTDSDDEPEDFSFRSSNNDLANSFPSTASPTSIGSPPSQQNPAQQDEVNEKPSFLFNNSQTHFLKADKSPTHHPISIRRSNPFSIESLLFSSNSSWG